jgi:hypothetical protein
MYWQRARHPRAGVAVGLAILAFWIGALGLALATGNPVEGQRTAVGGTDAVETAHSGALTSTQPGSK